MRFFYTRLSRMRSFLKGLAIFLFAASTVYASNINPNEIQLGSGVQYKLEPNDPQLISNQYLWTVSAVCTIKSKEKDSFLAITVTRKEGTLNGKRMSKGDSRTLRIEYGDEISITAVSGAEVELLNAGNKEIITECSFGF